MLERQLQHLVQSPSHAQRTFVPERFKSVGKAEQKRKRTGLAPAPNAAQVGPRIALLRRYRWSSYRAYLGIGARPKWLECETVLGLGGGSKEDRRRHYRNYVEEAVREGLEKSPWEEVREQVVLGSQEFLTQLRAQETGNARQSQALARMVRARPWPKKTGQFLLLDNHNVVCKALGSYLCISTNIRNWGRPLGRGVKRFLLLDNHNVVKNK